jgi:hypothetical protein
MSYGPVIRDGRVLYTSVSALTTADTDQEGCLRKWWFRYVAGMREAQTAAMEIGTQVHEEIDHYLTTGEDVLGRIAGASRRFLPEPGKDLRVEFEIGGTVEERAAGQAILTAGGIPVVGKIDLRHLRGRAISKAGAPLDDPPGTAEHIDWKTTRDWRYMKSDEGLMQTIQMPGYAEFSFRELPTLEYARLSHVVMKTEGTPEARKATILVDRERVARRWMTVDALGRAIQDVAREPEWSKVPANPRACNAFRGCPYRNKPCTLSHQEGLTSIFGPRLAESLVKGVFVELSMEEQIAGLMAQTAPTPPAAPVGFSEMFARCVATIRATTLQDGKPAGFPVLNGAAAEAYAALCKADPSQSTTSEGPLKGKTFSTPEELQALAGALVAQKFTPKLLEWSMPGSAAVASIAGLAEDKPKRARDPEAEELEALADARHEASLPPTPPAEEPKKRVGRPAKPKAPAGVAESQFPPSPAVELARAAAEQAKALPPLPPVPEPIVINPPSLPKATPEGFTLLVNAITESPATSLRAYIDDLHTSVRSILSDKADVRVSTDERVSFGKWKVALGDLARQRPPAPGTYVIHTADEVDECVVNALRPLATLYARGVK